MKKSILFLLIAFIIPVFFAACNNEDEDNESRDSLFVAEMVRETLYRDAMPMNFSFNNGYGFEYSHCLFSALDCFGDTIEVVKNELFGEGVRLFLFEVNDHYDDGIFCLRFEKVHSDSTYIMSDVVYNLKTRELSDEFKAFADEHFDINKYKEYEYLAGTSDTNGDNIFQGTREEWDRLSWKNKQNYLPGIFQNNLDENFDNRFYSAIARNTMQSGCGWDDAVNQEAYTAETFFWHGSSEHMDEYIEHFKQQ